MPVYAYESAMAGLPAELDSNDLFIHEEKDKAWALNEELCEKVRKQLEELKMDICKQCRKNFELEKEVNFFDQRIALLINHKISVEEFPDNVSFGEHRLGALKDDLQRRCFGNLFYLLQTEPKYLAKLTRSVAPTEIDELLQIVMFVLYGNQYEPREEHLLLKMFELALQMEFDETDKFGDLMRANTAISRMMHAYTRRGPGQEYLKETLQEIMENMNANTDLNLEVNPVKVYCALYNVVDDDRNSIMMERALKDREVANIVMYRLKGLEDITTQFYNAIIASIDYIPYGIRWLCKAMYQLCLEKFPDMDMDNITGLIGGFFLLRFINPAIVSPHNSMLLNSQPRPTMRRNCILITSYVKILPSCLKITIKSLFANLLILNQDWSTDRQKKSIAKLLQAMSNRGASQVLKEVFMKPLHSFVTSRQNELQRFLQKLCDVDDFHSYLEIEQYLSLPKDMNVVISLKKMYRLHELLCKYQDFLIDDNDRLTVLLEELGLPVSSSLVDNVSVDINLFSRWDVTSTLKSDLHDIDKTSDRGMQHLRIQCRKLLTRLLVTAPTLIRQCTLNGVLEEAKSCKNEEITKLAHLARSHLDGLCLNDPTYDDDVFYNNVKQHVMQQELQYDRMLRELKGLKSVKETMKWHGDFLTQQLDAYKEYLQAVRNKAAIREGRASPGKGSKQATGPFKFTYLQLEKEGVILESKSITDKRKQAMSFTVFCADPGIYKISMYYKIPMPGQPCLMELDLRLEDLLEVQHFRDPILNLNDHVVLDVRRTLLFLHKYFAPKKL